MMKRTLLVASLAVLCPVLAWAAFVIEQASVKDLGIDLSAIRDGDMVGVRLKAPRKGKLRHLSNVAIRLQEGERILLLAPLGTQTQNQVSTSSFEIASELADKCWIDLVVATSNQAQVYGISLKANITDKKE